MQALYSAGGGAYDVRSQQADGAMCAVEERFRLPDLAARGACVERVVDPAGFRRFAPLCLCRQPVRIRLSFCLDDAGRMHMDGELSTEVVVSCHRCLVPVETALRSAFSVVLAVGEHAASRLGSANAVLQVDGDEAGLAELVEDELILTLPQRPCTDATCPQAQAFAFPEVPPPSAEGPFQALGALKTSAGAKPQ